MKPAKAKGCQDISYILGRIEENEPSILVELMYMEKEILEQICSKLKESSSFAAKKYNSLIQNLILNHNGLAMI